MRVWKQWTDEHRKTGSGRRKVTSARNDRHLLRTAVNDRTASSSQLAASGCTATGSPSRQTINGCFCNGLMSTEPGKLIGTKLSFQMNPASICGTMMVTFVLDTMPVNAAFQRALSNDIMALHPKLWYVCEMLQLEVVPFLQNIPGSIFQQDNPRLHVAKTVRDFCSARHMQLLPWPAYSPDTSPVEHVWDLVVRRLSRDPRPAASKGELLLCI
ncbi:transposable element Tcb2 transposase [Trichonephila clavipes]|nr:transposable element Tcb2 transposase [Trichonephila clavipes]